MKRLLWYLNHIPDSSTTAFRYTVTIDGKPVQKEIYDGECEVIYLKPGGDRDGDRTGVRREPTYWQGDIAYTFERTNRMAVNRPTVTIEIPVERLSIAKCSPAEADYCLRYIAKYFEKVNAGYENKARTDADNGKFYVYNPGGKVLTRNAAYFATLPGKDYKDGKRNIIYETRYVDAPADRLCLCIRIEVQLPFGKMKRARKMLVQDLPNAVDEFLRNFDVSGLQAALKLEEHQKNIRKFLRDNSYCAFIANGSILARNQSEDKPQVGALPFESPKNSEIEVAGIRGMGIKQGVTVITGGGYSGKSTVLNAISAGIYNHVSGDGRELCITDDSAVTITAEDGRAISDLNISPFIKWIPGGNPAKFSTTHASGSTSQGANIMEAIAADAKLLLIDEDRSATNFMIRDAVMKSLIQKEPITPFTDRVRELDAMGVSTILVIGGSGEYLGVSDKVYMMDEFVMHDVTAEAKAKAPEVSEAPPEADWQTSTFTLKGGISSYPEGSGREKLAVSDTGFIIIGDQRIDVRKLHDIATPAQVTALAFMLRYLAKWNKTGLDELEAMALAMRNLKSAQNQQDVDMCAEVENLYAKIEESSLNLVDTGFFTEMDRFMDMPRPFEVLAAMRRMRV